MWRSAVAAALLLLVASCGGPDTTTLPLQDGGLDVGGDIGSQATDVYAANISDAEAQKIGNACDGVAEVADQGGDDAATRCLEVLSSIVDGNARGSCEEPGLCLNVYDVDEAADLESSGVVEVVDTSGSLCADDSGGVCLRVGLDSPQVLAHVVAGTPTTTPSATTTTPSSTATEPPTSTSSSEPTPSSTEGS